MQPTWLPDTKASALLDELEAFFSQGSSTDRLRQFIGENEGTFALIASESAVNTDTEVSLRLYHLFQKYGSLIEALIGEFMATMEKPDESMLQSLTSAIQEEWKSPNAAYRCVCTSYVVASMDYKEFLEFVDDMYSMTHYRMLMDEDDDSGKDDSEGIAGGASNSGWLIP
ncbi:The ARF-like 2 binding protein BART, putative [Leishmania shawi]|uniref:The ARF-like 2 binding protein BART n=2 Tax=Leishmania guyanensis species complex TaxID=38579 RepID=A0ABR3DYA6_9TRYP